MNVLKAILIAYFVLSSLLGLTRVATTAAKARKPHTGAIVTGVVLSLAIHVGLILAVIYA